MPNRWTKVRTLHDLWLAKSLIEVLEKKFPNIKFKIGKISVDNTGVRTDTVPHQFFPETVVPILANLPTPHPNQISQDVCIYARNLELKLDWKETNCFIPKHDLAENCQCGEVHHIDNLETVVAS